MCSAIEYLVYPPIDCWADYSRISGGFPHSEIPGSRPVRGSPGLIAAYHVLHRLLSPRHPPDALLALDPIRKTRDAARPEGPTIARHLPDMADGRPEACHRPLGQCLRLGKTCDHASPAAAGSARTQISCSLSSRCQGNRWQARGLPKGPNEWAASAAPGARPRSGGGYRARTDDPLLAKQMLSQLS